METYLSLPEEHRERIASFEAHTGVVFTNKTLLLGALTHSSGALTSLGSNERLEFLGDSILGFLVCRYLFETFTDWNEGELTKIKSAVVSGTVCARLARELGYERFIVVGRGVAQNRTLPESLLADTFEAVVAALCIDQGLEAVQRFVLPLLIEQIDNVQRCSVAHNFKSALQQFAQREHETAPIYRLLEEKGPDHDKSFLVAAQIGGTTFESAWGRSKKLAEQRAAALALKALGIKSSGLQLEDLGESAPNPTSLDEEE